MGEMSPGFNSPGFNSSVTKMRLLDERGTQWPV